MSSAARPSLPLRAGRCRSYSRGQQSAFSARSSEPQELPQHRQANPRQQHQQHHQRQHHQQHQQKQQPQQHSQQQRQHQQSQQQSQELQSQTQLPRTATQAVTELHRAAKGLAASRRGDELCSAAGIEQLLAETLVQEWLPQLSPRQLALSAWSLARLAAMAGGTAEIELCRPSGRLSAALLDRAAELDAQGVSMVLWALAKLSTDESLGFAQGPRRWLGTWRSKRRSGCQSLAFARDCRICVQAKGKNLPHRQNRRPVSDAEPPVLQLDYSYWKTKDSADVATVLVGNLSPAGYGLTFQVRAKGSVAAAVAALLDWSMEAGLCGQDLRARTDAEPSVMALGQAFACRRAPATTFLETAPVRSFGSIGAADRFAQSAAAQGRALRASLEQTWGEDLPTASPLVPWLVRHSAWLCNRFQPRGGEAQGQTAFEALQGRRYTAPALAWSAPVAAHLPTALQQGKLADRWVPGVFLGKSALADDNIIGAETRIMRVEMADASLPAAVPMGRVDLQFDT
ncbi:unnamed protein product [Polarella glacialis]|uniref:Uncharacterized protein n=1 Tax=Polarella glacialis TaxID=89957 RepID=A0A813JNG6_POLGL|nr:unnamed protein product [Polarella glacialis]